MKVTYIGARTRARAKAMSRREETSDDDRENNSVSVKRRKLSNYENQLKSPSLTFVQTKTNNDCDRIYITSTSALEREEQSDFSTNAAWTSITRSSGVEASCCSSTTTTTRSSVHEELLKVSDLDKEERVVAETSARNNLDRSIGGSSLLKRLVFITSKIQFKTGSGKPDSETTKKKPSLVKINNASQLQVEKMPPEAELEEYFATVQQPLIKRFKDKYNYDIVNDIPLEGRFEWIQAVKQENN